MLQMSSIASSMASGSLVPAPEKNLIPLSAKGLWEALMTIPASAFWVRVMSATAGVGMGPRSFTSTPILAYAFAARPGMRRRRRTPGRRKPTKP